LSGCSCVLAEEPSDLTLDLRAIRRFASPLQTAAKTFRFLADALCEAFADGAILFLSAGGSAKDKGLLRAEYVPFPKSY